jgi:hypothetical protein
VTAPEKRSLDEEKQPGQPAVAAAPAQAPPQPLSDQLQSTVGNAAVGTLLGRTPGAPPPGALVPYTGMPLLPRFSGDTIHVDSSGVARPQPELPSFSRDPIHLDPSGVARPQPELRSFSRDPIHLDPTGVAREAPPLPVVSGAPIFLDPTGGLHTSQALVRGLNATLDSTLAGVFARRKALLRRAAELRLPRLGGLVQTDQYAVYPAGSPTHIINATQVAAAEAARLDRRLAYLQPARWDTAFAKVLTEANADNWKGLKADWKPLKDDFTAVAEAMSAPAPPPADFAARVGRLTRAYLKYLSYPPLKTLYGDRLAGKGLLEGVPSDLVIAELRRDRPEAFLVDDVALYREAYGDVKLIMRRGLVELTDLNNQSVGGTGGQRYLPKKDLTHRIKDGPVWSYHLSVAFTGVDKGVDKNGLWRRITTVHVTFRPDGADAGPRYWWKVVKGDLERESNSGGGHQDWMLPAAKALLETQAKKIDCRPPT